MAARDIDAVVREVCLWLPEAEEFVSHGSPNFRVRGGKIFASYAVNTHGDGRLALWLNSPPGAQAQLVRHEPKHFFVPPYVGTRGWVGVVLDSGLSWTRIAALVREAYENTAPRKLTAAVGKTPKIAPPTKKIAPERWDPMEAPRARKVLATVRAMIEDWPEVSEERQYGHPVWRVGKRVFLQAYDYDGLMLAFWVGVDRQSLMLADPRFCERKYQSHLGWIALDVATSMDRDEVRALALDSYRHFATKRALSQLDA